MTSTPDSRWLPVGRGALALAPGLSFAALLTIVDAGLQPNQAVIGVVVLAPLLTVLVGGPRDVATVGAIAIGLVVLSGIWRHNFGTAAYHYRIGVVAAVIVLAVLLARGRAHASRDRERFALLAAVAEIADGTRSLQDTVAALNDLVVPTVADICIVDAVSRGELHRLAVRVLDGAGEASSATLLRRPPATPDALGDPEQPRLLRDVDDAMLRQISVDPADLERLHALRVTSCVVVPLRARGRRLGSLTLIVTRHSGRRYGDEDLEFAKVLAGRTALALDNAGLFSELETIEAQLTVALSTLAEAVTIQHAEGALMYANEAAARMFGFDSPRELLATPVRDVVDRFHTTREDGRRCAWRTCPAARCSPAPSPCRSSRARSTGPRGRRPGA